MRVVFFGCTEISYHCLKELLRLKAEIAGIFTTPQNIKISYAKNGVKIFTHRSFAALGKKNNIPVIVLKNGMKGANEAAAKLNPDIILVAGWYYMIPDEILKVPKYGCLGLHASLLPKYSGNAPVNWAIINGEKKTGITLFYFARGVDNGDIVGQRAFKIGKNDDCKTVYDKAMQAGVLLLRKYIPLLEKGKAPRYSQDEKKRTVFPARSPKDGLVDWNQGSKKIYDWIRAQTSPYPGAFTFLKGKKVIIWKAKLTNIKAGLKKPGNILAISKKGILISTKDNPILITSAGTKPGEILPAEKIARKLKLQDENG